MSTQPASHRPFTFAVVAAVVCLTCLPALAARGVRGPMDDLHVTLPVDQVNGPCTPASYPTYFHPWPPYVNTWPQVSDHVTITCDPTSNYDFTARAVGYVTSPTGNFSKGQVGLVTIYGRDLNPGGDELMITGFNPARPEMSFSSERYTGIAKTDYPATSAELVPVSQLPALLGSDFDLSPFASADPGSVVYVFQASMPAKNLGARQSGVLLSENFDGAWHHGQEADGSFGPGTLPGTVLRVDGAPVEVLGERNGANGSCSANPGGNCLDLVAHGGPGSVSSTPVFDLDTDRIYTVQFTALAQGLSQSLNLAVQLGSSHWDVVVGPKAKTYRLSVTPAAFEAGAALSFAAVGDVDGEHGPVLSAIVLCAKDLGSTAKGCPKP